MVKRSPAKKDWICSGKVERSVAAAGWSFLAAAAAFLAAESVLGAMSWTWVESLGFLAFRSDCWASVDLESLRLRLPVELSPNVKLAYLASSPLPEGVRLEGAS